MSKILEKKLLVAVVGGYCKCICYLPADSGLGDLTIAPSGILYGATGGVARKVEQQISTYGDCKEICRGIGTDTFTCIPVPR